MVYHRWSSTSWCKERRKNRRRSCVKTTVQLMGWWWGSWKLRLWRWTHPTPRLEGTQSFSRHMESWSFTDRTHGSSGRTNPIPCPRFHKSPVHSNANATDRRSYNTSYQRSQQIHGYSNEPMGVPAIPPDTPTSAREEEKEAQEKINRNEEIKDPNLTNE